MEKERKGIRKVVIGKILRSFDIQKEGEDIKLVPHEDREKAKQKPDDGKEDK